jgi:hypothetical protein
MLKLNNCKSHKTGKILLKGRYEKFSNLITVNITKQVKDGYKGDMGKILKVNILF